MSPTARQIQKMAVDVRFKKMLFVDKFEIYKMENQVTIKFRSQWLFKWVVDLVGVMM